MAPLVDLRDVNIEEDKNFTLQWVDELGQLKRPLSEEGPDEEDLINKINPPPIMNHRENRQVKSIVKGSKLNLSQKVGGTQQQQQH